MDWYRAATDHLLNDNTWNLIRRVRLAHEWAFVTLSRVHAALYRLGILALFLTCCHAAPKIFSEETA